MYNVSLSPPSSVQLEQIQLEQTDLVLSCNSSEGIDVHVIMCVRVCVCGGAKAKEEMPAWGSGVR